MCKTPFCKKFGVFIFYIFFTFFLQIRKIVLTLDITKTNYKMKTQTIKTEHQEVLAKATICQIAKKIIESKITVAPAAHPYLRAMLHMDSIEDNYMADSGRSVVLYFLANAQTMKGELMRDIKAELNKRAKR